jgi:hypothetical protein
MASRRRERALHDTVRPPGNQLIKSGDFEGAYSCYSDALRLHTGAALYGNRAYALLHLNRHEEALADCDRALALDPAYAKVMVRKSSALKSLGRIDEAVAVLQQVLPTLCLFPPPPPSSLSLFTYARRAGGRLGRAVPCRIRSPQSTMAPQRAGPLARFPSCLAGAAGGSRQQRFGGQSPTGVSDCQSAGANGGHPCPCCCGSEPTKPGAGDLVCDWPMPKNYALR